MLLSSFAKKYWNLPCPPYSADLAAADYHVFRELNNSFSQIFDDLNPVKTAIQEFLDSKLPKFCFLKIYFLPERWSEVIASIGAYGHNNKFFHFALICYPL